MSENLKKSTNKEWYKQGWGLIAAILFFPYFIVWYAWARSKWSQAVKVIVTAVVALVMLPFLIAVATTDTSVTTNEQQAVPQEEQANASKQESNDPKPEAKKEPSLAEQVEEAYLKTVGYKSFSELRSDPDWPADSKVRYINGLEDVNSDTVRVFVQTDLTKEEAKFVGVSLMGVAGYELKDLNWIVVRGTDGLDVNVSRSDAPALGE